MLIRKYDELKGTEKDVHFKHKGFRSLRYLLDEDMMGFTVCKTIIPKGLSEIWHYKNHLEACYCIEGVGKIENLQSGEVYDIKPDIMYALDKHDKHRFTAVEDVVLISIFNPPLTGKETHDKDGVYQVPTDKSPVYNVKPIHIDKIKANSYNPNAVAPPEMKLLETSIWEDGYTMPIVCYYVEDGDYYEIVDGYHRYTTMLTSKRIRDRENGYLPVSVINKPEGERMASTIRHNRARGSHNIELMSNIVAELVEMGKSDAWILKHIGMDADELLRLKQITGLAALFKDREFSRSWEV